MAAVRATDHSDRFASATTSLVARRCPRAFLQALFTWSLYPIIATPERAKTLLFSSEMPDEVLGIIHPHLQDESSFAFVDMRLEGIRPAPTYRLPALVMGSETDALIRPAALRAPHGHSALNR